MLLSIIVPVYNTEKYLRECLDSIIRQTCDSIEIILINDGSTDGSGMIMQEYKQKYPDLIRVINQENHGIGYTRNKGIELANGKYITFIDSDDTIENDYCERMCEKAEAESLDMVVCDFYEVDEKSHEKKCIDLLHFEKTDIKHAPELIFEINSSPWNKVYRTELVKESGVRFPEELKYEDVVYLLKFMGICNAIGKVDKPLVNYLIRVGSQTTSMNKKVFDIFQVLEEICSFYSNLSYYDTTKVYLEWFCINRITVYNIQQIYQKRKDDGMKFIEAGFAYLSKRWPEWKKNRLYIQNNCFLKRILKGHKSVAKMFVKVIGKGK